MIRRSLIAMVSLGLGLIACGRRSQPSRPLEAKVLVERIRDASRANDQPLVTQLSGELARLGQRAISEVGELLEDDDPRVANVAMGLLGAPENREALDIATRDAIALLPSSRVKGGGPGPPRLDRLGSLAVPAMADALRGELPTQSGVLLVMIAAHVDDNAGLPVIEKALVHPSSEIKATAAWALGEMKAPNARERLQALLDSSDVELRGGAIDGLRILGDTHAVPALLHVLELPDAEIPQTGTSMGAGETHTLHSHAAHAIDELIKLPLDGNVTRIREWLSEHPQ